MARIHVRSEISPEDFLSDLTYAAYREVLKQGLKGPFVDIELNIRRALREVIRREMLVTDTCGLYSVCQESTPVEPWTKAGIQAWQEM